MEIIYGTNLSNDVEVDTANSIMNRLNRLLLFWANNYATYDWEQFLDRETKELRWAKIALAGHSQGSGHAALIARDIQVNRVLFFNSPSDKDHALQTPLKQPPWFYDPHLTPDSAYYAFYHQQNGGANRLQVYNLFGLGNFGAEINVDLNEFPYNNAHILYTDSTSFEYADYTLNACGNAPPINPHSDIIVDCELPIDEMGNSPYKAVWKYMLSHTNSSILTNTRSSIAQKDPSIFPNPSKGRITIQDLGSNSRLELYAANGLLLSQGENQNEWDLSSYANGLYFIKIISERGQYVKRVVKNE